MDGMRSEGLLKGGSRFGQSEGLRKDEVERMIFTVSFCRFFRAFSRSVPAFYCRTTKVLCILR